MANSGWGLLLLPVAIGCSNKIDGYSPPDVDAAPPIAEPPCGDLVAIVRDFRSDHPDMEMPIDGHKPVKGLVENRLGADGTPVYAPEGSTDATSGPDAFDQWYHDTDGVNQRFEVPLELERVDGVHQYDSIMFFPIDGMGWSETFLNHNFHFTTEIHTTFEYAGGESFTFIGDDDVWVFVNGRLAIDLGGLHEPESGTVDFDAQADVLGLEVGQTYELDVFHAERHTGGSNFRVETSIDCPLATVD